MGRLGARELWERTLTSPDRERPDPLAKTARPPANVEAEEVRTEAAVRLVATVLAVAVSSAATVPGLPASSVATEREAVDEELAVAAVAVAVEAEAGARSCGLKIRLRWPSNRCG